MIFIILYLLIGTLFDTFIFLENDKILYIVLGWPLFVGGFFILILAAGALGLAGRIYKWISI